MITENFWFENEDVEWSFKLCLIEETKMNGNNVLKILVKNTDRGCCFKEGIIEKTVPLENIPPESVEVKYLVNKIRETEKKILLIYFLFSGIHLQSESMYENEHSQKFRSTKRIRLLVLHENVIKIFSFMKKFSSNFFSKFLKNFF